MLLGQCSNIFKIMPIIMLVFVNYAHVSKKKKNRNCASTFCFKFGRKTSITMQKRTKS